MDAVDVFVIHAKTIIFWYDWADKLYLLMLTSRCMYSVVICFCAELEYKLSHEAMVYLVSSQEPITCFLVVATFTLDKRIVRRVKRLDI